MVLNPAKMLKRVLLKPNKKALFTIKKPFQTFWHRFSTIGISSKTQKKMCIVDRTARCRQVEITTFCFDNLCKNKVQIDMILPELIEETETENESL